MLYLNNIYDTILGLAFMHGARNAFVVLIIELILKVPYDLEEAAMTSAAAA